MSNALDFVLALERAGQAEDGLRFQRSFMQRATGLLQACVGDSRPATVKCTAQLGIAVLFPPEALELQFTIDHWAMVPVVEVAAAKRLLRIKQTELKERDGLATYGVLGLVKEKPIIAVTAAPMVETVFIRIGGFDRSIVWDREF